MRKKSNLRAHPKQEKGLMTHKEFWSLKHGDTIRTFFKHDRRTEMQGKVIRRHVQDEVCGFVIGRNYDRNITTGRKILEVTIDIGNGEKRYLQSNRVRPTGYDGIAGIEIVKRREEQ